MISFLCAGVVTPPSFAVESPKPISVTKVLPSRAEVEPPSHESYAKQLSRIPQFASFGTLFKSTRPQPLTESETEYVVECIKHIFPEHLVFQVIGSSL